MNTRIICTPSNIRKSGVAAAMAHDTDEFAEIILREESLLDIMEGQVNVDEKRKCNKTKPVDILKALDIEIHVATPDQVQDLNPDAIITGKMFGQGIYFAPSAMKSWGYTSAPDEVWTRRNAGRTTHTAFMALYATAYGKPYELYSHTATQAHGCTTITSVCTGNTRTAPVSMQRPARVCCIMTR
ncbi:hypothetical protein ADH76_03140 [Enterocloster clostridioformis]|nr:hypothetical protein [Enterocloster clostridioformis]ANU44662.1 hypothetical protein A4V08_01290 [Lachnoclostridium sp. YL32]NDO27976.1 hypothetical protein [Enterocloster clostridioformis]OXE70431.1 hypothetical protein ADH76_03140 [Enterocloster clostridioformis]